MRKLKAMPGWHEPLADRLWKEVQDLISERDRLRAALQDKAGEVREPIAWEATTDAYIKHITDAQYQRFSTEVKHWYKPYKCSSCAEKPAHSYEPAGVLMHWPMPGGGRKIIWSEDDLTAITIGCPVTNIFKESAVAAQPAPVVPQEPDGSSVSTACIVGLASALHRIKTGNIEGATEVVTKVRDVLIKRGRELAAPVVPDGFALVPVEATFDMRAAGNIELDRLNNTPGMLVADRAFYVWAAMISASRQKGGQHG